MELLLPLLEKAMSVPLFARPSPKLMVLPLFVPTPELSGRPRAKDHNAVDGHARKHMAMHSQNHSSIVSSLSVGSICLPAIFAPTRG